MQPRKSRKSSEGIVFRPSSRYTLGVEIELQTLESNSFELVPLAPRLISLAPPLLKPRLTEELICSILEIKTGICFSLDDIDYDLQQTISLAEELAKENDAVLHCSSLHPFAAFSDQEYSGNERYVRLLEELQLVGRQFISQGIHIHVGMVDKTTAIAVLNGLQPYLSLLLAVSGSSPFFQGVDTGFASYRTMLFKLLPLSGEYAYFNDWQHYLTVVENLIDHQIITSVHDLWWDARLSPDYGTVEVRICDLPGRYSDILALVAVVQSLVATVASQNLQPGPYDPYLLQANKWQAARHGLQGRFIDVGGLLGGGRGSMGDAFESLIDILLPAAVRLGCKSQLSQARWIVRKGTTAEHARKIYRRTGNFKSMLETLTGEFWK